jgi:hypothetical protein
MGGGRGQRGANELLEVGASAMVFFLIFLVRDIIHTCP